MYSLAPLVMVYQLTDIHWLLQIVRLKITVVQIHRSFITDFYRMEVVLDSIPHYLYILMSHYWHSLWRFHLHNNILQYYQESNTRPIVRLPPTEWMKISNKILIGIPTCVMSFPDPLSSALSDVCISQIKLLVVGSQNGLTTSFLVNRWWSAWTCTR